MAGLPRVEDTTRPKSVTQVMLYGSVEAMTNALRRGYAVDAGSCATIEGFIRRAKALEAAYIFRTGEAIPEEDDGREDS